MDINELRRFSTGLRMSIIEQHAQAGGGHLGSPLSIVDILVVLFLQHFRWCNPSEDGWRGDKFVLSKGHAALALYCILERIGRIPNSSLAGYGKSGAVLEPHPNERREPSIHASTGSLGQGLSIGVGLALGSRLRGAADRTFVVIGDGEANEGQIWEAARCGAMLGLSNLVVILDDNGMQQDGLMSQIMPVTDLVESWRAMGWHCVSANGHDCEDLLKALDALLSESLTGPKLLHARTVKGYGIPYLAGSVDSHYPPPLLADDLVLVKYMLGTDTPNG